jgi:hypothetical protein
MLAVYGPPEHRVNTEWGSGRPWTELVNTLELSDEDERRRAGSSCSAGGERIAMQRFRRNARTAQQPAYDRLEAYLLTPAGAE